MITSEKQAKNEIFFAVLGVAPLTHSYQLTLRHEVTRWPLPHVQSFENGEKESQRDQNQDSFVILAETIILCLWRIPYI